MTTKLDYYGILQVHPGAEKEVIDAAYRKLASKYHPDVSHTSDTGERMKRINIAYEVLSDPVKRAAYDANRGVPPSGTSPRAAAGPIHPSKVWRNLLIAAGIMLLSVAAFRLVPALLLLASRLLVPIVVVSLFVWLFFILLKPRR